MRHDSGRYTHFIRRFVRIQFQCGKKRTRGYVSLSSSLNGGINIRSLSPCTKACSPRFRQRFPIPRRSVRSTVCVAHPTGRNDYSLASTINYPPPSPPLILLPLPLSLPPLPAPNSPNSSIPPTVSPSPS